MNSSREERIYFLVLFFVVLVVFALYTALDLTTKDGYNTNLIDAYLRDSRALTAMLNGSVFLNFDNDVQARFLGLTFHSFTLSSFVYFVSSYFFINIKHRALFSFLFIASIALNSMLYLYLAVFWTAGLSFFLATLSFVFYLKRSAFFLVFSAFCSVLIITTYQILVLLPIGFVFLVSFVDNSLRRFSVWAVCFFTMFFILMVFLRSDFYLSMNDTYSSYRSALNLMYTDVSPLRYFELMKIRVIRLETAIQYKYLIVTLVSVVITHSFFSSKRMNLLVAIILLGSALLLINPVLLMNSAFNTRAYSTVVSVVSVFLSFLTVFMMKDLSNLNGRRNYISLVLFFVIFALSWLSILPNYFFFSFPLVIMSCIVFYLMKIKGGMVVLLSCIIFSVLFTFQVRINYLDKFRTNYDLSYDVVKKVSFEIANVKREYPEAKIELKLYYGSEGSNFYNLNVFDSGKGFLLNHSSLKSVRKVSDIQADCPFDKPNRSGFVYFNNEVVKDKVVMNICF